MYKRQALVKIEYANEAAKIMTEEMERPIDFSKCSLPRGILIIPCEIEYGYNYKELSKFKGVLSEQTSSPLNR